MAYVILHWNRYEDISLVVNTHGEVQIFKEGKDAKRWAEVNAAFNYKIVEV